MKRMTFGQMRACKLPPPSPNESADMQSLRMSVASDHPDTLRAAVSDSYADLVDKLSKEPAATPASKPEK